MKIETLKKRLDKVDSEMEILKDKRQILLKQIENICEHPRVVKSGGGMWHEWPDYGYYPYHLSCIECNLSVSSDDSTDKGRNLYYKLSERVVKDESK